jgi:hypothetical protein
VGALAFLAGYGASLYLAEGRTISRELRTAIALIRGKR